MIISLNNQLKYNNTASTAQNQGSKVSQSQVINSDSRYCSVNKNYLYQLFSFKGKKYDRKTSEGVSLSNEVNSFVGFNDFIKQGTRLYEFKINFDHPELMKVLVEADEKLKEKKTNAEKVTEISKIIDNVFSIKNCKKITDSYYSDYKKTREPKDFGDIIREKMGVCRHRAVLFKLICDYVFDNEDKHRVRTCITTGLKTRPHAWNVVKYQDENHRPQTKIIDWSKEYSLDELKNNPEPETLRMFSKYKIPMSPYERKLNANLRGMDHAYLSKRDYHGKELLNKKFEGQNLRGKSFVKSKLNNVNFHDAKLGYSYFNHAKIDNCEFSNDMYAASFMDSDINNSKFNTDFDADVSFCCAKIENSDFSDSMFDMYIFSRANLIHNNFSNSEISLSDFSESILLGNNFENAQLNTCDFENAIISKEDYELFPYLKENYDYTDYSQVNEKDKRSDAVELFNNNGITAFGILKQKRVLSS